VRILIVEDEAAVARRVEQFCRRIIGPRLEWLRGLVAFLANAAPWLVLVSRANPEFARFLLVHQHFERIHT
jgi:hypothetical protein